MKSTTAAYLLWFFLGAIGIHKFYVGKAGMGVLYIILTTIGVATVSFVVGFIPIAIVGILLLVDLFTLPNQIREANENAAEELGKFQAKVEAAKTQN